MVNSCTSLTSREVLTHSPTLLTPVCAYSPGLAHGQQLHLCTINLQAAVGAPACEFEGKRTED